MAIIKAMKIVVKEVSRCKKCCATKSARWGSYTYVMGFSLYEILQLIVLFVDDLYFRDVYSAGFYSRPKVASLFEKSRIQCGRYCNDRFDKPGAESVAVIGETVTVNESITEAGQLILGGYLVP